MKTCKKKQETEALVINQEEEIRKMKLEIQELKKNLQQLIIIILIILLQIII